MRSKQFATQKSEQMNKSGSRASRRTVTGETGNRLPLNSAASRWLAGCLIALLLLSPVFSLPVSAATVFGGANAAGGVRFERTDAARRFWVDAYENLSAKIEKWLPARLTAAAAGGDTDKKVKPKVAAKKDADKDGKPKKRDFAENDAAKTNPPAAEIKSDQESPAGDDSVPLTKDNLKNMTAGGGTVTGAEGKKAAVPSSAKSSMKKSPAALLLNQLPSAEHDSVYFYENNLGSPAGQVEMDSPNRAAALNIRHRAGIANFSFNVPLAELSGRGIDAGVGMTYNSRIWNESQTYDPNTQTSTQHFTYDVEQSWIAPGFSSGFGYLETRATAIYNSDGTIYGYRSTPAGLTDADGTRHELYCKIPNGLVCSQYETSDGSFIRVSGDINTAQTNAPFTAVYPNGMKIYFVGGSGTDDIRKYYPVILQDNNGNRIQIVYKDNQTGRIDYINDTLNRRIKFYYETDAANNPGKLIAVTMPGINPNDEIQTVRFYYENLTLNAQAGFMGEVTAPTDPIQVLQYVYFPTTKTGFKYDYHPIYGMIKKISRYVGMTADSTSTAATGMITSDGSPAASTEYDYPNGMTALSTAPKYTGRTDEWAGRTAPAPAYTFYDAPVPTGAERTSTVTARDVNFDTEDTTVSYNTGDWMNGLVKETSVTQCTGPVNAVTNRRPYCNQQFAKTSYFWLPGTVTAGRRNPQLQKVETTNDAGQTQATGFVYDEYNNQTQVTEYGFAAPGSLGAVLRTTNTGYQTGSGWINNANLLRLVTSVTRTVAGAVVSKTLYEYDHNGNDATLMKRGDIAETGTHDIYYNPDSPAAYDERVCPTGSSTTTSSSIPANNGCFIIHHYGYVAASAYRGNVTKIGQMIDVSAATISSTNSDENDYEYDITGNTVSATLSCCQLKKLDYGDTFGVTGYAYPVKETKGDPAVLTTKATYNYNTGLVTSSMDENAQMTNYVTSYEYEPDTLRAKKTNYPNGGYVLTEYSDKLGPDPISYVRTTTTLESSKTVPSYSYYDGRGAAIRTAVLTPDNWSVTALEYDALGRARKSYNPFYVANPNDMVPSGTKYTQVTGWDSLGRTTQVTLQDTTTVNTEFSTPATTPADLNQPFVTVTDQAGKQRRQVADALGRLVRVDEPNSSGSLGAVDAPTQPTVYEYDGNDNLTKVTQTGGGATQERRFKYDALSRLTQEKQVEADATLDDNGTPGTIDPATKWTKVLKYDTQSLLTDGWDARGVNTHFTYDGINRVKTVTFSDDTPQVTYNYDQARGSFYNTGALTRIETAAGGANRADTPATATEYDYDIMGRVAAHRQIIDTQTYNMSYVYNLAGQMTSETYPSGKVVTTGYDTGGRLATVSKGAQSILTDVSYTGKGNNVNSLGFNNNTAQGFGYNDRLQLISQEVHKSFGNGPTSYIQLFEYGYGQVDSAGMLDTNKNNGQIGTVTSTIGTAKQYTQKFSYDAVGRLAKTEEYRGDDPTTNTLSYRQVFDYDRFGNLYRKSASQTAGQQPLPYTHIEDGEISKTTNRFTADTTYDPAGNVTTDSKFSSMNYSYDANGRMFKTTNAANAQSNSVYDALGQRVAQQINGSWEFFIYDAGGKKVAEYGGTLATDGGGIRYVFADWQGSTRMITGDNGAVKSRTDYTAFGEEITAGVGQRTAAQKFGASNTLGEKYAQTERDKATGLDHTWFRKNETKAGRWTSPDPYGGSASIGDPQSFNRYSYVENQPTNFVDPSGLNMSSVSFTCYDIVTTGHYSNDPDSTYVNTRSVCHSSGGGGGGGEIISGGGGGSSASRDQQNQSNNKKPKCRQGKHGEDVPEIKDYLDRNGLYQFINIDSIMSVTEKTKTGIVKKEGVTFSFKNAQAAASAAAYLLDKDSLFINAKLGSLHDGVVSGGEVAYDFRSKTYKESAKSLQFDIGKPDATGSVTGYADLDCHNPKQGVGGFFGHLDDMASGH